MFRQPFFSLLIALISSSLWAQKSNQLDFEKSLKNMKECERINELKLIKTDAPLSISCQIDNMHYFSDVQLNLDPNPVRIGNFNLLHPGTDKTLFKDFFLVAELINEEFDLLAGIELMDVVATPRENNGKLLPVINKTLNELKSVQLEISQFKIQIQNIDKQKADSLHLISRAKEEAVALESKLEIKKVALGSLSEKVLILSGPGFTLFGIEFGKLKRLELLQQALNDKAALESDIGTLEQQLSEARNNILALEIKTKDVQEENNFLSDGLHNKLVVSETKSVEIESELKRLTKRYRIPGYLRILEELRKFDPSWSLIVSPHGESVVETNAQELVGFFYRASKIKVDKNVHCSSKFNKISNACYPNFGLEYMGEDFENMFSRRPFLGSFTDGRSTFSVLAAHVIFESPTNPETQKTMLEKVFKVSSLAELPTGINKNNYARFIEVYLSLLLAEKLRLEGLDKIIYMGDFNLESVNPFWNYVFTRFQESKLLISDKTSLSETRFSKGLETKGVSSNYDHFILSSAENSTCRNATVVNFIQNRFSDKIKQKYLIRSEAAKGPYERSVSAEDLILARTEETLRKLSENNFLVSREDQVSQDTKTTEEDIKNFQQRVFESQLSDETYYKFYVQTISDHLPIKLECEF